jgi:hypothetical protein
MDDLCVYVYATSVSANQHCTKRDGRIKKRVREIKHGGEKKKEKKGKKKFSNQMLRCGAVNQGVVYTLFSIKASFFFFILHLFDDDLDLLPSLISPHNRVYHTHTQHITTFILIYNTHALLILQ